jgi:predicted transcriptional regulator
MKQERLHPGQAVYEAACSPLITELRPIEFVVYLRLVGLSEQHRKIYPLNVDLHRDARAAVKALRVLEERSLIKMRRVSQKISKSQREIEVLR